MNGNMKRMMLVVDFIVWLAFTVSCGGGTGTPPSPEVGVSTISDQFDDNQAKLADAALYKGEYSFEGFVGTTCSDLLGLELPLAVTIASLENTSLHLDLGDGVDYGCEGKNPDPKYDWYYYACLIESHPCASAVATTALLPRRLHAWC